MNTTQPVLDVHARTILHTPLDHLWATYNNPATPLRVICDDGVLTTTQRDMLYSQYLWSFHRAYPNTPLLMKHLLPPDEVINKGSPLRLLGHVFWSTYDAYHGTLKLTDLQRLAYDTINLLYNEMVRRIPEYMTSLSARDAIEVIYNKDVRQILDTAQDSQAGYDEANRALYDFLKTKGVLVGNRTAEAVKTGLLAPSPVSQLYGLRGAIADIDNTMFPNRVATNYAIGLHKLHDYAIESRSASKFLYLAGSPLQHVEYKNREFQLLSQSLRYMFKGDCQSEHLLPIRVNSAKDLELFSGKYHYVPNEQTGVPELHRIVPEETHLIGQKLYVRSVLGCHCLQKQGVCEVCVGELSLQFPENSTVGHISIIELCSGISQSVLSAKHLDTIRKLSEFAFDDNSARLLSRYVKPGRRGVADANESRLMVNGWLKRRQASLVVAKATNLSLPDITQGHPVDTLCLSRTSHIKTCRFEYTENGDFTARELDMQIGTRAAYFTVEFLKHIKAVGYSTVQLDRARGDKSKKAEFFSIPLDDWDFSLPVFDFQHRVDTTMDFMKQVTSVVKAKQTGKQDGDGTVTMEWLSGNLMGLHELVNSRFKLNLAHSEIISSLCLVRNTHNDYRFPSPDGPRGYAPFTKVMQHRSLTAWLAYEKHLNAYLGLGSFLNPHRPSHTMDKIYYP